MFKTTKVTKRTVENLLYELSKEYKVRIFYSSSINSYWKSVDGHTSFKSGNITLSRNQSAANMIATFFHELGHVHCCMEGKWKSFHTTKLPSEMSKKEKSAYMRTALKAERWVDKWAETEMKKHFPKIKYPGSGYSGPINEEVVKSFKEEVRKYLYE